MDNYLRSRGSERLKEAPLLTVESQQGYVHYRKASVVLYYLKEMIGEETVNAALRKLIQRYGYNAAAVSHFVGAGGCAARRDAAAVSVSDQGSVRRTSPCSRIAPWTQRRSSGRTASTTSLSMSRLTSSKPTPKAMKSRSRWMTGSILAPSPSPRKATSTAAHFIANGSTSRQVHVHFTTGDARRSRGRSFPAADRPRSGRQHEKSHAGERLC